MVHLPKLRSTLISITAMFIYQLYWYFFTLDILYCQAFIQTMDQTQVINLQGLLRYI
jgi:hypothetical protein